MQSRSIAPYVDCIVSMAVELSFTAHSLTPFARACGHLGEPRMLDGVERLKVRCRLDGLICALFGLTRPDVEFILSSFQVLHRSELKAYGRRETYERVLAAYDEFKAIRDTQ